MGGKEQSVVIFAEEELHSFYKAFATGMDSTKILACPRGPAGVASDSAELVIIDCGFRSRMGLALLKKIKQDNPATMVVMISEKSSEETVIEAFQSGVRYYLKKPINIPMLRRVSKNLLEVKKKSGEKRLPYAYSEKPYPAPSDDLLSGKPPNLIRAVHFIEDNLGSPLDLETIAREGHLSKYQFCRFFKNHLGVSPMNFVNSKRIDRAKELLVRDELNVTEIALYIGFKDHGTFIRAFKKRTGFLPSDFRKMLKSEAKA